MFFISNNNFGNIATTARVAQSQPRNSLTRIFIGQGVSDVSSLNFYVIRIIYPYKSRPGSKKIPNNDGYFI
jgi:hypothetical protein